MKKLIIRFILFLIVGYLVGEVIVRTQKLTSDIPQRYVDANGIQMYIPYQKGYYIDMDDPWEVNKYGWLGVSNIENKAKRISIIGDSYIENLMNPKTCNQGYLLEKENPNIGFFEAGRSGVTFIEAMEIAKQLDSLNFNQHLIYVSADDFYESFADQNRYTDRMQYDIESNKVLKGELKSSGLKKILYNTKFLYYLYLRFPLFVSEQNMGEIKKEEKTFEASKFEKILNYCNDNYNMNKITLVFHPGTSSEIINFFNKNGVNHIVLKETNNKTWALNSADGHWSCYGHKEASKQVSKYLQQL